MTVGELRCPRCGAGIVDADPSKRLDGWRPWRVNELNMGIKNLALQLTCAGGHYVMTRWSGPPAHYHEPGTLETRAFDKK